MEEVVALTVSAKFSKTYALLESISIIPRLCGRTFAELITDISRCLCRGQLSLERKRVVAFRIMSHMQIIRVCLRDASIISLSGEQLRDVNMFILEIEGILEKHIETCAEHTRVGDVTTSRKKGRPRNASLPEGNSFVKLIHDSCLAYDQVKNWINEFIQNEQRHNFSIMKRVNSNEMIDPSSMSSHTIGCMFCFHMFTHRLLDTDASGAPLYSGAPVMGVKSGILDRFTGRDEISAEMLRGNEFVWIHTSITDADQGRIFATPVLLEILKNAHAECSGGGGDGGAGTGAADGGEGSGCCEISLFTVTREVLIMNQKKRYWHLSKARNWIRQLFHRNIQRNAKAQTVGHGESFLTHCMEMIHNPRIQSLHLHGARQLDPEEMKFEIRSNLDHINRLMCANDAKRVRRIKTSPSEGGGSRGGSSGVKRNRSGAAATAGREGMQRPAKLTNLQRIGARTHLLELFSKMPSVEVLQGGELAVTNFEWVEARIGMQERLESVTTPHKAKLYLEDVSEFVQEILEEYADKSDARLKECTDLHTDYENANAANLATYLHYAMQKLHDEVAHIKRHIDSYADEGDNDTTDIPSVSEIEHAINECWVTWEDAYVVYRIKLSIE